MKDYRTPQPIKDAELIAKSIESAKLILTNYNLNDVTTERQKKNGTLCFHDPVTNCRYAIYADGAVRRIDTTVSPYRLNRSKSIKNGNYRDKRYIYQPGNYALLAESIENAVYKYRRDKIDMKIKNTSLFNLSDVEIGGINPKDYPDFADAYLAYATCEGEPLTEEQLEYLTERNSEEVQILATERA